jgi:phosphoribosylglycinamide formyltransferase-1
VEVSGKSKLRPSELASALSAQRSPFSSLTAAAHRSPLSNTNMPAAFPIVVLASGRGGTFAAILDAVQSGALPVEVRALLTDRRTAPVLQIAEARGVPAVALRPRDFADRAHFDRSLFGRVAAFEPQLVVLAGYLRVIDAGTVHAWQGRMINLHPSLLPKYPGLDTYREVLAAGDATYGASVHYVTEALDAGPVIGRVELPVLAGDNEETLAARLRPFEQGLLVATIALIAAGRIAPGHGGIELDGRRLARPLPFPPGGGFPGL